MQRVSIDACMEDPEAALVALQDDQRHIADELEATFLAYDRRLRAAAKRLAALGPDSVSMEEQAQLRDEQLELWRLVRRAQAAQRSTRELIREVAEWRAHEPTAATEGHPDHPETRVEIVESELRVRGVALPDAPRGTTQEPSASSVWAFEEPEGIHWLHRMPEQADEAEDVERPMALPDWEHDSDEVLLREIRHQEQELARTTRPTDIADLLKGLRTLHGYLRSHDRRTHRQRVRYTMGLGSLGH